MLHGDMASHYIRKASPFFWLRYQRTDGTWGDKTSGIRIDGDGSLRKIKQMVAQHTMNEIQFDKSGGSHRFDGWVPQFLGTHFPNAKTVARYMSAWSALSTYLDHRKIISPLQVTYRVCIDYPQFRTKPPEKIIRRRSFNTALTELKVFSAILQEAVKRSYITANPCLRLGLRRTRPKQKPEITREEQQRIENELATRDQWMRDCWLVAMRQGCRLSETAVPITHIDTETGTVMFFTKGGRVHTAPLHDDLLPLLRVARRRKRATLVELPKYPAKKWHQFFKRIGLPHLSFHCTRVTVVTRLARKGHTMTQTKAYVGHASDTVHAIYQRLAPADVRHLGEALSSPTA
jgi:integrase